MTEISRTVFTERAWGWPASAGPVEVDMSKTMEISWGKNTVVHEATINVRASHVYLSGVELVIIVNGRRAGSINWGAFDTAPKTANVTVTLVNGTNKVRLVAKTGSFVFPGSNQGGVVHHALIKVKFVGDAPKTTQARTSVATTFTDFLNQLASAAPWVLALIGIVGVVILIILIRFRRD